MSFRREKYVPNGGPDGGDGGKGGSIIFAVDEGLRTLSDFKFRRSFKAEDGVKGGVNNMYGKNGADIIIKVPLGTVIKYAETDAVLADMSAGSKQRVVARGGKGGKGNSHFATATRQAPRFAINGEKCSEVKLVLELKTIADVGIVGYPNVGKSTLLASVSAAKPKIANYPFTTLTPNIGMVAVGDTSSFFMADIPGLIEGASEGVGLGFEFLRHVERTRMLIHVVDVSGIDGRDPMLDYDNIMFELETYNDRLAKLPQVVAANKIDLLENDEILVKLTAKLEPLGIPVFPDLRCNGRGRQAPSIQGCGYAEGPSRHRNLYRRGSRKGVCPCGGSALYRGTARYLRIRAGGAPWFAISWVR